MAVLGLRFCARAFSSCGKRGPLFIAVHGPLTVAASLVVEHTLQTRRLSSCGSRAQLLHGMWDLPRPGLEPVSPALAGRFLTTAPPGKPLQNSLISCSKIDRTEGEGGVQGWLTLWKHIQIILELSKDVKFDFMLLVGSSPSKVEPGALSAHKLTFPFHSIQCLVLSCK